MARFRNILVHMYLEINLGRLYGYLQEGPDDLERYAQYIVEYMTLLDEQ